MKCVKILVLSLVLVGCTVVPKQPVDKTISFDGNEQNGGIVGVTPDKFVIVTSNYRNRYNSLIEKYGNDIIPPISKDFGLAGPTSTNTYLMTREAWVHMGMMTAWYKAGK